MSIVYEKYVQNRNTSEVEEVMIVSVRNIYDTFGHVVKAS